MNSEEFLRALEEHVRDSSLEVSKEILTRGRYSPKTSTIDPRSEWYNRLSESDKEKVIECMSFAIDDALFGFLCILDGVRIIEDDNDRGGFELFHNGSEKELINHENIMLHEMFIPYNEK